MPDPTFFGPESRPRFPRPPVWFWVSVLAGAVASSLIMAVVLSLSGDASKNRDRIDALETANAALADQVESLGEEPVVTPEDIGEQSPVVITGPAGPAGRDGKDGAKGDPGTPGANGLDGTNGADGIDGQDGVDGVDGADGQAGADGATGSPGPAPVSFTFTFRGVTYTCSDPDGDQAFTCTSDSPPDESLIP